MRSLRLVFPLLVLSTALATGCKQQLGDRCQVNSDCVEGVCGEDDICRVSGSGGAVFDGGEPDASIDAALDNPADAATPVPDAETQEPDAPSEPDADVPDADVPDAA